MIRKITETGEDKMAYDIWKKDTVQTGNGVKEKMKLMRGEENMDVGGSFQKRRCIVSLLVHSTETTLFSMGYF